MSREPVFRSENEFTAWLRKRAGAKGRGVRLGIGDDAALIEPDRHRQLVLTADLTVEGVHFTHSLHSPEAIGHRALARSLSDVAAMGGRPRFALIALANPRSVRRRWLEGLWQGIIGLARRFGVVVLGGDTTLGASETVIDVTIIGELQRARALLRSGARPGDRIFVAGELGLAALGLALLRSGKDVRSLEARKAVRAHLYPEPQCALGSYLAARGLASSAIDVSDGLSTDLARLTEASRAGACIWSDRIPAPATLLSKIGLNRSPLELALHGGEDYRLLFTAPAKRARLVPRRFKGVRIYEIGEMQNARKGIQIVGDRETRRLKPSGYDHFR